jgi:GntR family transcriptional regulator
MTRKSMAHSHGATTLKRTNARALHEQLSDRLRADLASARSADGQIGTEKEIGRTYGLSRSTVRRAIQTLVEEGALVRRQGKGTFLARPKPRITYAIDRFGPFMAAFSDADEAVSVRLLDFTWCTGERVPKQFGAENTALIYERLYESANFAHALIQVALPGRLGERISRADASAMGIYQILQHKLGITPVAASFNISSELPDLRLAQRLGISPTTPLLILERVSYDRHEAVVERTMHHLLPEVYKLHVNAKNHAS